MKLNGALRSVLIAALSTFLLQIPATTQAVTSIADIRISAGDHDAEESSLGVVSLTDGVLDLGGVNRLVGLRFVNVTVPKNAPITRAYIEFTAAGQDSANVTFQIEEEAEDSTTVFTTAAGNISARKVLATKVDWPVTYAWTTAGQVHQTADIKSIVQGIVQRSGWNSGNALTFFISSTTDVYRRVTSWNGDPDKAPKLHVEFSANVLDIPIADGTDDMYQLSPAGTVNNSNTFQLGYSSLNTYYGGLRFQNVNIPQGAVINYACLKVVANEATASQTGLIYVRGEKRLSPQTFSTTASNANAVAKRFNDSFVFKTNAAVTWGSVAEWTAEQVYSSPDLTTVIQEIIGQSNWDASDKSLVLLTGPRSGNFARNVWSYNGDPAKAPVLHIEYGGDSGGGGGSGGGVPVMSLGTSDIGRTVFQGGTPEIFRFPLINSGAGNLNYTASVIYNSGSGWLSLSPSTISGSLQPGEEQGYAANFNASNLTPGTYEATIRFADANASNSPQDVRVSLAVMAQAEVKCDDAPIFTKGVANPAVLLLLDVSGSMMDNVDLFNADDLTTRTPDIKSIVQELVNYDGWSPNGGCSMVFFVEYASGPGMRYARSYDGNSTSAPHLYVEYVAGGQAKNLVVQVVQPKDDGHKDPVYLFENFNTSAISLPLAYPGTGGGVGMRFEIIPIPKNATIISAYLQFVPALTDSAPIRVRITGERSGCWPSSFYDQFEELLIRPRTNSSVDWDIPPWTGVTVQKRIDIARSVISELFKDQTISWGFGTWTTGNYPWDSVTDGTHTVIHAGCRPHTEAHQTRLQAAVANAQPVQYTPLIGSLTAAKRFFAGQKKDDNPDIPGAVEDGEFYSGAACQPGFLIDMTDGMGNVPNYIDAGLNWYDSYNDWYSAQVRAKVKDLADINISSVAIGFALPEWEAFQLYALADEANKRGKASAIDALYAMHKEDETGKALPYLAYNKNQLMNAFRDIVSQVKGSVFYGSAPAATTSTDLGDRVLMASFLGRQWTGELEALEKGSNGLWATSVWKASEQVPPNRKVWTVDSSKQVMAYTESTLSSDNYLCKAIGDIINSTPIVVGKPPFFYNFDGYSSFSRKYGSTTPRERLVYVGSNDGLLHAFSLDTGVEEWAFLPYHLQAKLNQAGDMCAAGTCHQYLLDGSPQIADVYGKFGGGGNKWHTMLVIGQRQGGTYYTALDVTSGESPDPSNPDPAKFLWDFTDSDLGESWADAAIERVTDATGQAGATAWGVFLSSGYSEVDNLQANKEAFIFGLEADTGAPLWTYGTTPVNKIRLFSETGTLGYTNLNGGPFAVGEIVQGKISNASGRVAAITTAGATAGTLELNGLQNSNFQAGEELLGSLGHKAVVAGAFTIATGSQKNNVLSSPLVANFSHSDHTDDCIYAGDLYGSLYRVDNIGKGQAPSVSRLFKFNPYPTSPDQHAIRGKASAAYGASANELWIYFGTGRFETESDKTNLTTQYFMGLKDTPAVRATPYSLSDLVPLEARFATASVNGVNKTVRAISGTNAGAAPWALTLFSGQSGWGGPASVTGSERVFTKPLVVGGIVFFTSFMPDSDACSGIGETWVYALDYKTGLPPSNPVFDLNGDGKFTDADKVTVNGNRVVPAAILVGRGLGSQPVLFKDTLFVTTTMTQTASGSMTGLNPIPVNLPQKKVRVESWKHY